MVGTVMAVTSCYCVFAVISFQLLIVAIIAVILVMLPQTLATWCRNESGWLLNSPIELMVLLRRMNVPAIGTPVFRCLVCVPS